MAVLYRLAGLNVIGCDLLLHAPGEEVSRGKFRAVIHAQRFRAAAVTNDDVQHPSDTLAGRGSIDLKRQALTREVIDNSQHAHAATACEPKRRGLRSKQFQPWGKPEGGDL